MTYPKEIYRPGEYRVVFGPEEHKSAIAEGWSDDFFVETQPQTISDLRTVLEQPRVRRGRPPRVQSITEVA